MTRKERKKERKKAHCNAAHPRAPPDNSFAVRMQSIHLPSIEGAAYFGARGTCYACAHGTGFSVGKGESHKLYFETLLEK